MNAAQLRAEAREKDMLAEYLQRNPGWHRKRIRDLRIEAANLRSNALELEQKQESA